jgi:hypothetical protein
MERPAVRRWFGALASLLGVLVSVAATTTTTLAASPAETPAQAGIIGSDAGVWTKHDLHPSSPSSSFSPLGGILTGSPAVVSLPNPAAGQFGDPIFIATGTDHALWVRSLTGSWQHLSAGAIYCIDNPAAVIVNSPAAGRMLFTVACQGADHTLWYAQEFTGSPGSLPSQSLTWNSLGGVLTSGPAVAAVDPKGAPSAQFELTFFVTGTDGHVWTRTPASSGWSQMGWLCVGHPAAGGSLSSANQGFTEISVFACQGVDHQLWTSRNIGSGWEAARAWGGILVNGPGIAVTPTWTTVYARGIDDHLYQLSFSSQGVNGWHSNGGILQFGVGAAALLATADNP